MNFRILMISAASVALLLSLCGRNKPEFSYVFEKYSDRNGNEVWRFAGDYPPPLLLESNEEFIYSINLALDTIGLPRINQAVQEKEKLTGFRAHRGIYEWKNYPLGILTVERMLEYAKGSEGYDSIWKIRLKKTE
jgi:hypothetical protein